MSLSSFHKDIIRNTLSSPYYKSVLNNCSILTIIDEIVESKYIGTTYSKQKFPTPFLCLLVRLTQIQPPIDIVNELLGSHDLKYLRQLMYFYVRMNCKDVQVYKILEQGFESYNKIVVREEDGKFKIINCDEIVEILLTSKNFGSLFFPHLTRRNIFERKNKLSKWVSNLNKKNK